MGVNAGISGNTTASQSLLRQRILPDTSTIVTHNYLVGKSQSLLRQRILPDIIEALPLAFISALMSQSLLRQRILPDGHPAKPLKAL